MFSEDHDNSIKIIEWPEFNKNKPLNDKLEIYLSYAKE